MTALQSLPVDADCDTVVEVMKRDGAVILENVIDEAAIEVLLAEVMPFVEKTATGRDDFTGRSTQRTGALVARSPACRELVMDQHILAAANGFLSPYTERILLHLTQTIRILPGQGAQTIHRDRLAWGTHLPHSIEPQLNSMWALTDFTLENGATRVVPGSNGWAWDQRAASAQICQAEMNKGSVLLYSGSVLHSGGENRSAEPRLGLNITYCLGWLRQEENQYLSCPPHIARTLEPELQELLGYTMGNYALGYYSEPAAHADIHSDIQPPEAVLGRRPRKKIQIQDL
jgi:ectoine hydroxylase-related dioxygenase (phytanoyl-CoA dioxygenase family)